MRAVVGLLIVLIFGLLPADRLDAQETSSPELQQDAVGPTPPRLSFVDGHVSFFRPGAGEWAPAQVNMPLSPGDRLQTGSPGNLELQIGGRAFARGWADTRIELTNQAPDRLQFEVAEGHVAFDLHTLEPGHTVEVDTPNAAFTIDHAGYYRLNVAGERTTFSARRGGRAVATPAGGASFGISPDEEVAVEGTSRPEVSYYPAPPLDVWDSWNYARTDELLETESARHVPPGIYGTSDLDRYGHWREVPGYGPVWAPAGVPSGWVPYSTGSWVQDPYYGWTWVDTAPWGWAPYHYGRWVHVDRSWCWAPGPRGMRPVYSPALVAFYGGSHSRLAFGATGRPVVGWVALGWGEPCLPWWGRPGFIHRPWWGGWAGPRVVNNVVVHRTTVVQAEHIHDYRNARVNNAVVGVHEDHFHRGALGKERFTRVDPRDLKPMRSAPRGKRSPGSDRPQANNGFHPPKAENVHRHDRYPEAQPPAVHRQPQQPQTPQRLAPSERTRYSIQPDQGPGRIKASPSPPRPRIESSRLPARQQPNEPAGRLVPSRLEERSPQRVERGVKAPERVEQRKSEAGVRHPTPSQETPFRGVQRPGGRPLAFPRAPGGA